MIIFMLIVLAAWVFYKLSGVIFSVGGLRLLNVCFYGAMAVVATALIVVTAVWAFNSPSRDQLQHAMVPLGLTFAFVRATIDWWK